MATKKKEVKKKMKSPLTRTMKINNIVNEAEATRKQFREVWSRLEAKGLCDGIDGIEYNRVVNEWMNAGTPELIAQFIRERANVSLPLQQ